MGDFKALMGRKISDIDAQYGAVASNTIGPWSLKVDVTPNANGALLIDVASQNGLRHVTSH